MRPEDEVPILPHETESREKAARLGIRNVTILKVKREAKRAHECGTEKRHDVSKQKNRTHKGDGCCGMTLSHPVKNRHYNSLRLKNKTAPHTISSIHHITTSNVPFTSFLAPKPQTKGATFFRDTLWKPRCVHFFAKLDL